MRSGPHFKVLQRADAIVPTGGVNASLLRIVSFTLQTTRYALPLGAVERVVPVVEFTPLPKAPEIVLGIVNLEGRIIPVLNVRRRFGYPDREVQLSDQLIVARTSRRPVALLVDRVEALIERAEHEIIQAPDVLPGLEYVRGVAKLTDGLVLIHDLDTFLSLEEEQTLGQVLAPTGT
jgi:purine-binding chemotaxis protein CheW